MGMVRVMGLFALIPMTILLTISFFVLFALRKVETQGLKALGQVVAVLLWIGALLIFSLGVYIIRTGRHPMMSMMQEMMKCKMQGMMGQPMPGMMHGYKHKMMKGQMPQMQGETVEPMTNK